MSGIQMAPAWLGILAVLILQIPGPVTAQEPCQGKRAIDPRTARLQVLNIEIGRQGIVGRVKNTSGETALGVMVWVNYYLSRRGGLKGQQCIPVGDLRGGEEATFQGIPIAEADGTEAFDYAVDAAGWR